MKHTIKFLSLIVLVFVLLIQVLIIYKKSYSGYMFNPKISSERVNIDYVMLAYNLDFIKDFVPQNEETIMSIIFNQNEKYNICLFYYYNLRMFYPIKMPADHRCADITNYTDEILKESLKKNNNNYLVFIGKNIRTLNIETQKDISIYKVDENINLSLVKDYDNNLYSLRENSKFYKKNNYNEVMHYIEQYIKNYSYLYGYSAYEYLYDYANLLIENNEKDLASVYYKQYLELPLINNEILQNKIKIYDFFKEPENVKSMKKYCETVDWCELEDLNMEVE